MPGMGTTATATAAATVTALSRPARLARLGRNLPAYFLTRSVAPLMVTSLAEFPVL
jgi:hypothetical protein